MAQGSNLARTVDLPTDPYAALDTPEARRAYYAENGYLVVRGAIPAAVCDEARRAFEAEVKPYPGFLYRQASGDPERHRLSASGHVLNSLLNVQDFDRRRFARFRAAGLAVITHPGLQAIVRELLGQPGRVVQSMYFEGNPVTWAHQDTYYLDGDPLGSMTAAWVALEDIHADAGRFFIYPRSQKVDMERNGGDFDIAFNHERYKALVQDLMRKNGLECRAPALRKGDALFWTSKTVHGSLPTKDAPHARSSITAHFVPASGRFIQYQRRQRTLHLQTVNGVEVHHPKDQNRAFNRALLRVEAALPRTFKLFKKVAVKALTR